MALCGREGGRDMGRDAWYGTALTPTLPPRKKIPGAAKTFHFEIRQGVVSRRRPREDDERAETAGRRLLSPRGGGAPHSGARELIILLYFLRVWIVADCERSVAGHNNVFFLVSFQVRTPGLRRC